MKIAAHPLVVAVALGFLDPQVLSSEESTEEGGATDTVPSDTPSDIPVVDTDDFARIEAEWQQVRGLV
jgi:hypothetical protein